MTLKKFFWIWLILPALLLCASCASPSIEGDPINFLLISVDAIRADHFSCCGYDRHTLAVTGGGYMSGRYGFSRGFDEFARCRSRSSEHSATLSREGKR